MTHSHHHGAHDHARHGKISTDRAFAIGVTLNLGFVAVEAVFGLVSHSLALLADAGHNLSDVLGLLLAWGAASLSRRRPTATHTYGLRRSSILAALGNAMILLVAVGAISWEAVRRFVDPAPIEAPIVAAVALVGIAVNGATALLFARGRAHDLNIRGAFLHMVADAAVSAGVVVTALLSIASGWLWLDPLVSLIIAAVILVGTWGLLRDSFNLALDAVPSGIDATAVEAYLAGLPGVVGVHDLHIWALSTTEIALTAHLVRPGTGPDDAMLAAAAHELQHRFRIGHATFQVEHGDAAHPCRLAPADVV